jgi:hypothetical protein
MQRMILTAIALQIIFVLAKLFHVVDWHWCIVLLPGELTVAVTGLLLLFTLTCLILTTH